MKDLEQFTVSNDYALVEAQDYNGIWIKYRPLFMRYYMKMLTVSNCDFEDFDDFLGSWYEPFTKAIQGIKLEKVKDPSNFGLYMQLSLWLGNFTKRRIRDWIKIRKHEEQFPEKFDGIYTEGESPLQSILSSATKCLSSRQFGLVVDYLNGTPAYHLNCKPKEWQEIISILRENI